jgi:quercetin dioxygenase-like cupin family protein
MPIEIRRFGVGQRRPDGPAGTTGVSGQVVQADASGAITELAFSLRARMEPHVNPHATWFVVIEGGGWVGVGEERTRVAAGEAVLFPPSAPHAAWTEHSQMRAFMIEFPGSAEPATFELTGPAGHPTTGAAGGRPGRVDRAEGALAAEGSGSIRTDPTAGEPS